MTEKRDDDAGLRVEQTQVRGATLLTATGYIDISNSGVLEDAMQKITGLTGLLIVDLTDIDFLGSAGLSVLARAHVAMVPPAQLVVVADHIVARPLTLTGLDRMFAVRGTLDEALALDS